MSRWGTGTDWASLHAAGMTATQAARACGRTVAAAYDWARKAGAAWPNAREGELRSVAVAEAAARRVAQVERLAELCETRGGPYDAPRVDDCRALWAAVLVEVWQIAALPLEAKAHLRGGNAVKAEEVAQCRRWFGSRDFHLVCAFIGADSDAVLDAFRAGVVPVFKPAERRKGAAA